MLLYLIALTCDFMSAFISYANFFGNIVGPVPVIASEDETSIKKIVTYQPSNDKLIGFCGKSGDNHECVPDLEVYAGDDYETLLQKFQVISYKTRNELKKHNGLCFKTIFHYCRFLYECNRDV